MAQTPLTAQTDTPAAPKWGAMLRTPAALPLGIFVVSALPSLWAAYDTRAALIKFGVIVSGSIAFFVALVVLRNRRTFYGFVITFAATDVVFSLYYLTQRPAFGKFGPTKAISNFTTGLLPALGLKLPHPNIAAGVIAFGFALAVVSSFFLARNRPERIAWSMVVLFLGFSLFVTESRGAWIATCLATVPGLLLLRQARAVRTRNLGRWVALCAVVLLAVIGGAVVLLNAEARLQDGSTRIEFFRSQLPLVADYPFTGYGLDLFEDIYYHFIEIHNLPPVEHPHNLYLALLLEEGIPGLAALLFVGLACARQLRRGYKAWDDFDQHARACYLFGAWAFGMIALHGLVDNVHYSAKSLPVAFIALAFLFMPDLSRSVSAAKHHDSTYTLKVVGVAGLVILAGVILWKPTAALWLANMGAVAHSRADMPLSTYPIQSAGKPLERPDSAALREQALRDYRDSWALWPSEGLARRYVLALYQQGRYDEATAVASSNNLSPQWLPGIGRYFYTAARTNDPRWSEKSAAADTLALHISPPSAALEQARQRRKS